MKKVFIIFVLTLAIFLIAGCVQKPVEPNVPVQEPPKEEPEQICTAMGICRDDNTRVYRNTDCTFTEITNCPNGCENGECKSAIPPKETLPETKEEVKNETSLSCNIGWKCMDAKRKGYQSSNCAFSQVDECQYGCKDGACITTAPPEEKKEETFTLTEGKAIINKLGDRYADFSKGQIFQDEVYDKDLKIRLYSKAQGRDYLRVESPTSNLWIIEKGITDAGRADCMEKIVLANAYGSLKSGQTLCVKTKENNIALLGGYWEGLPTESTELSWKYYS